MRRFKICYGRCVLSSRTRDPHPLMTSGSRSMSKKLLACLSRSTSLANRPHTLIMGVNPELPAFASPQMPRAPRPRSDARPHCALSCHHLQPPSHTAVPIGYDVLRPLHPGQASFMRRLSCRSRVAAPPSVSDRSGGGGQPPLAIRSHRWWLHLPVRSKQDDHLAYHLEEPANRIQHFGDALEAIERLLQVLAALD